MRINNRDYDDIFQLAKEMYLAYDIYASELRKEELLAFIDSQDSKKAAKIKAISLLSLPDDIFVFKASYILNPFMSLRFKGFLFKDYQELGTTMLSYAPSPSPILTLLVRYSLISEHMKNTFYSEDHPEVFENVQSLEKYSEQDLPYAYYALAYFLSKKKTIIYQGVEYQDVFNFVYYLCKQEKDLGSIGTYLSKSSYIRAYSEVSDDGDKIQEYLHLCKEVDRSQKDLEDFLLKKRKTSSQVEEKSYEQ